MKIAAIIPAYNEEETLASVIDAVQKNALINEVIVVDDGSFDRTAQVAKEKGVKLIQLKENVGKGKALEEGVRATDADILFFLDADLVGLTSQHVSQLLNPVLQNEADMTVGAIDRSNLSPALNKRFQKVESPLSGIRVLRRNFWAQIPAKYKKKFYIESVMHYFAKKNNIRTKPLVLHGVVHIIKEKKLGLWEGTKARWKMNWQILLINIALRVNPDNVFKD